MALPTTYQLYIRLSRPCRIQAGRLASHRLPAGWYVYTGSARRNLVARVERHLSRDKTLRWHIDWLLSRREARVIHVSLHHEAECDLNAATGGEVLIAGFGATDCRARCGSHLRYLGSQTPRQVPEGAIGRRHSGTIALQTAIARQTACGTGSTARPKDIAK
ncbi:GIY-YIG nuclease family protein [Ectothiorhodospira shaposhnikovii]|uniref:GIY-YIG nuclease family protein n=1 Tax=Ectothiorhodospira shaposhnikovii TaxID=1054 RepID=UPI001EE834DE|nr:GIY-YIG nuclease family protein [Ectothiorhodospira shaposhnikovii]MCG5512518.1 GIY-YIG nuclease family protein [Ectothiorhodospira shaposhnikovii]